MIWRAAGRDDAALAFLWAYAAGFGIAARPLLPAVARLLPACPFHALTGLPCPTCGVTRAVLALLRGDASGALQANPLGAVVAAAGLLGGLLAPVWILFHGPVPRELSSPPVVWRVLAACALLSNWAYLVARH